MHGESVVDDCENRTEKNNEEDEENCVDDEEADTVLFEGRHLLCFEVFEDLA